MKSLIFFILFWMLITSCSVKVPAKSTFTFEDFEKYIDKNRDQIKRVEI